VTWLEAWSQVPEEAMSMAACQAEYSIEDLAVGAWRPFLRCTDVAQRSG